MLLLSIFVWATAAASLDTAASISAAVESFRCDLVKSIIARQPSADASSASAFCSTFIRAEQKTFTAATVTSTVRGRCFATQPAQSVSLTKRELENRAVRSPGVLCPKYMTALGTNALSRACSCLTAAPITTTPTAFLTVFTPVTTTTTSTVTVTPTASTIYLASISSKLLTSTATIISLTTSQAVSTGTAYSTATVSDISTVISLRPVTTVTVVSTITILSTQTILSTTTSTTTATSLVKRLAPPSSPASSLPAAAPTGCYTVTSTAFATITIARPTLTIALPIDRALDVCTDRHEHIHGDDNSDYQSHDTNSPDGLLDDYEHLRLHSVWIINDHYNICYDHNLCDRGSGDVYSKAH
ncbi:hypothetical protein PYCC9005_002520 [Savitreella phatthalungensis]